MRLATYLQAGQERLGAVDGNGYVDLNRAYAALRRSQGADAGQAAAEADALVPADVLRFLALGAPAVDAARAAVAHVSGIDVDAARADLLAVAAREVTLLPPVPRPPKIICVARNYAEHAREAGLEISPIPIVFARFAETLVADGGAVVRPTVSEQLDWEGELAIVIGKGGRHIQREEAMDHVAGYSIFNDVTVRDFQFRVTQYTSGKNFSASGPFGPHLVLADEVADPHALEIRTEVGGVLKQTGNTSDMIYDIPTIIEHISEWITLEPGDVIPTGTPAGVGFKRNPPEFLRAGDTVSVTVEGLGTLTNPVVAEAETAA
ncbi:MAG TPA: fumarylacetoacetate hydrolase family protein [Solirubrobacteraceae bacterium]|nr:fumarylacetoacetate hydrolase family protein [Solirubrobacteraceae bacterium]